MCSTVLSNRGGGWWGLERNGTRTLFSFYFISKGGNCRIESKRNTNISQKNFKETLLIRIQLLLAAVFRFFRPCNLRFDSICPAKCLKYVYKSEEGKKSCTNPKQMDGNKKECCIKENESTAHAFRLRTFLVHAIKTRRFLSI